MTQQFRNIIGFSHSGYGKDLSMYGREDFTRIKHVMSYIGE